MTAITSPPAAAPARKRGSAGTRRYIAALRSGRGMTGLVIIAVLVLLALAAPLLFPGGYDQQSADALSPPSLSHIFGTDELGRDLLARSLYGLRVDLSIVFAAVPITMVAGTTLGFLGGLSKIAGTLLQRVLDIILGFPGVILGVCVALVVGPGWTALVIAIAISGLPAFGRLARTMMIEQQQREYVIAARTLGIPEGRILVRHILPNAADPILVQGAIYVVYAIFIEAGLSIVGLGIQPPQPSLGAVLNVGMRYVYQHPTYVVGPMIVLLLLALAFSLLADALNSAVTRK